MSNRISRADTFTSTKKKVEYFSDFLDDFGFTPIGNELARVTNEKSVNQSIRNLIFTNINERLYQPYLGSGVIGSMFELSGIQLQNMIIDNITATIQNFEPRAVLQTIVVSDINSTNVNHLGDIDNNMIEVTISYTLINNPTLVNLTVLLRRVR
jgi:phage baseplate assembly protein W